MVSNPSLTAMSTLRFWIIASLICATVALVTYIAVGPTFIRPKYTSESVFFVPLTLLSKHIEQQGIGFAGDAEIDAHIQILKSRALQDSLLSLYPELRNAKQNPYELIDRTISISKTRYGSVSVSVTHENPQLAAGMANAVVALGDIIKEAILQKNRLEMFTYYKDMYLDLEKESQLLERQLDSIRENNLGNSSSAYKINSLFSGVVADLNHYKSQYAKQKKGLETPLPQSYIISEAAPANKPSSPIRLLWASIGGLFAFLFCITWASFSK